MGRREHSGLSWSEIKEIGYPFWRNLLDQRTQSILTSSNRVQLSDYNNEGYFHLVQNKNNYEQMKNDWQEHERVPQQWMNKGRYGGLWVAMFDEVNTYSHIINSGKTIRFYFKDGYSIFDKMNKKHLNLENTGRLSTLKKLFQGNRWDQLKDGRGIKFSEKIKNLGCPGNKGFYKKNKFGAVIGYRNYVSPVIVLEDSVKSVEFLDE
jgi:hypothetical protein